MADISDSALSAANQFAGALHRLASTTPGLDQPVNDAGATGLTMVEEFAGAADPDDSKWEQLQQFLSRMSPEAVAEDVMRMVTTSISRHKEVCDARDRSGTVTPIAVTDADFEKLVLKATLPVVVDYWAPWCGPCLAIAPILEVLAAEMSGQVTFAKVNVDENEGAARHGMTALKLQGIPTLVVYVNGEIVNHKQGAEGLSHIREFVRKSLGIGAGVEAVPAV